MLFRPAQHQRFCLQPILSFGAFTILKYLTQGDSPGGPRFRWVKAPSSAELRQLPHTIAHRVSRFLERQGLLVRDAEFAQLTLDAPDDDDPMHTLIGHSITYRIATGPRQGRKALTLQTLPAINEPPDIGVGNVAGFSLHAGVAAKANERDKLERLCRYITLPYSKYRALITPAQRSKGRNPKLPTPP